MSANFKFILFSAALPAIFTIYGIFTKRYDMVLNSLGTILCILAFAIFHKKVPVLKTGTYFAVVIFILLSVFAGRALKFYEFIPCWDKMLHFLSGFIFAPIGKQIYAKLNGDSKNRLLMNLFAIFFAVATAGIWEIYEFSIDGILGTNSQNGSLNDTMWDIIAGSVSAVIAIIFK